MKLRYTLKQISNPLIEPVTVSELKTFLRISHVNEDAVLSNTIKAARQYCENFTGQSFITRDYKVIYDVNYGLLRQQRGLEIDVPRPPLSVVNSVKNGNGDVILPEKYTVNSDLGRITFEYADIFFPNNEHITIEYTAGYGVTADDIPESLRHAVLMKATQLYENRGDEFVKNGFDIVSSLLSPYRQAGVMI